MDDVRSTLLWVADIAPGELKARGTSKTDGHHHGQNKSSHHDSSSIVDSTVCPPRPPPNTDPFSWAALIAQHTKAGQGRRALKVYKQMRDAGVTPTSHTLVAALKACSSLKDLKTARQVHTEVIQMGLETDVFVATMLVHVYAKCGEVEDAWQVFDKMPRRNVVSWTAMILGYANMEQGGEKAMQLYARMQEEGIVPDSRAFVGVLKACTSLVKVAEQQHGSSQAQQGLLIIKAKCLEQVRTIHSQVLSKTGPQPAVHVANMLLDAYSKCGSLMEAKHVFDTMTCRNAVSWNAMMMGYAQMRRGREALQLYAQMQQEGMPPDDRTFVSVLKACSSILASSVDGYRHSSAATDNNLDERSWCLGKVRAIHTDVMNSQVESDAFVANMLVDVYLKCGSLSDARHVFDRIECPNVVSWTTMILGYTEMGEGETALQLYAKMRQQRVAPDARAFVAALRACSTSLAATTSSEQEDTAGDAGYRIEKKAWCLEQVRSIHSDIVERHCESDVYVGCMLLDVYAKCGSLDDARRIFEEMPRRNVVCWTAMILGYVSIEEGEEALKLYMRMQLEGVVPDDRTFVGVLKACGTVAGLDKGKELHAEICNRGLVAIDLFVSNAVIDMYGKCGSMVDAQRVFDALHDKDVVTWSALMAGYARQGESEIVLQLFQSMGQEGLQPNDITFVSLLAACSHAGLGDKGKELFESMTRDFGISPTLKHYTCMVDLLGRVGEVEDAMAMAKSMPFRADGAVWETVLSACRKWRRVELGREAFDRAMCLDRNDASAYVLMCNIYEDAQMWEEANCLRAMRAMSHTWKQRGQSLWTDAEGIVHAFAAGDQLHPQSHVDLYVRLRELGFKMNEE